MFCPTVSQASMTCCIEFSASCLNMFVMIREPAAGSAVVVCQLFQAIQLSLSLEISLRPSHARGLKTCTITASIRVYRVECGSIVSRTRATGLRLGD